MDVLNAWINERDGVVPQDVIEKLNGLKISGTRGSRRSANGKKCENSLVVAAQKCLKTAQKRILEQNADTCELIKLCQSCLRFIEGFDVSLSSASQKSFALVYNTVRAFVSVKAFSVAFEEALRLHRRLLAFYNNDDTSLRTSDLVSGKTGGLSGKSTEDNVTVNTEAANTVIGSVLSMAISWSEGATIEADWLKYMLFSIENVEIWYRFIKREDKFKYSHSLFKAIYRGLITMASNKEWESLTSLCLVILRGTMNPATSPQILRSVGKVSSLAPDSYSIRILKEFMEVPILNHARKSLVKNEDDIQEKESLACWKEVKEDPTLALSILESIIPAASSLRKLIADRLPATVDPYNGIIKAVGGLNSAINVVSAIENSVLAVSVGFQTWKRISLDQGQTSTKEPFSANGHSVAVALATTTRIRAALAIRHESIDIEMDRGTTRYDFTTDLNYHDALFYSLGWKWDQWSLRSNSIMSPKELIWLSSQLLNCGSKLLMEEKFRQESIYIFEWAFIATLTATEICWRYPEHSEQQQQSQSCLVKCVVTLRKAAMESKLQIENAIRLIDDTLSIISHLYSELGMLCRGVGQLLQQIIKENIRLLVDEQTTMECLSKATGTEYNTKAICLDGNNLDNNRISQYFINSPSASQRIKHHRNAVPFAMIEMIAEAEIVAFAAMLEEDSDVETTGTDRKRLVSLKNRIVDVLLTELYPGTEYPVQSCRLIILLHSLGLQIDGSSLGLKSYDIFPRALEFLRSKAGCLDACILRALVLNYIILGKARVIVESSLERQKKDHEILKEKVRHRPAEAARLAAEYSVLEQETCKYLSSHSVWYDLHPEIKEALKSLDDVACLLKDISSGFETFSSAEFQEFATLVVFSNELATLTGMQGLFEFEQKAMKLHLYFRDLLQSKDYILSEDKISTEDELASPALSHCILPKISHLTQQFFSEAEQGILDNSNRDANSMLRRAKFNIENSLIKAFEIGKSEEALHHASEAHRLLSVALSEEKGFAVDIFKRVKLSELVWEILSHQHTATGPVGWWEATLKYVMSLLLLGRLFERSGMRNEAIHAFQEGERLAIGIGSSILSAAFSLHLADIQLQSGQDAAAEEQLSHVLDVLTTIENIETPLSAKLVIDWCFAFEKVLRAKLALNKNLIVETTEYSRDALKTLLSPEFVGAGPTGFWTVPLSEAQYLRLQLMKHEKSSISEIIQEAIHSINMLSSGGGLCSVGRLKLLLLLSDLFSEKDENMEESLQISNVLLWCPNQLNRNDVQPNLSKDSSSLNSADVFPSVSMPLLWRCILEARNAPHLFHRVVHRLSPVCAALGYLHISALLLHSSNNSTIQLQHRLVMHTRLQHSRKRQKRSEEDTAKSVDALNALKILEAGFDWEIIGSLSQSVRTQDGKEGLRLYTNFSIESMDALNMRQEDDLGLLERLDEIARGALCLWMNQLPPGTAAVTMSSGSSKYANSIILCRMEHGMMTPLLIQIPIETYRSQNEIHPIRYLQVDENTGADGSNVLDPSVEYTGLEKTNSESNDIDVCFPSTECSPAVMSAIEEMEKILKSSTSTMKDLPTDTRDQQREWWRARVDIDDRLGALLNFLDSSWLGPWKCVMMGVPKNIGKKRFQLASSALDEIEDHLARLSNDGLINYDCSIGKSRKTLWAHTSRMSLIHLMGLIITEAQLMRPSELRQAAVAISKALKIDGIGTEDGVKSIINVLKVKSSLEDKLFEREGLLKAVNDLSLQDSKINAGPIVEIVREAATIGNRQVKFFIDSEDSTQVPEAPLSRTKVQSSYEYIKTPRVKYPKGSPQIRSTRRAASKRKPKAILNAAVTNDSEQMLENRNLNDAFEDLTIDENCTTIRSECSVSGSNIKEGSSPEKSSETESNICATPGPTAKTVPRRTARTVRKHKSRLAMMATPAAKTVAKDRISSALRFESDDSLSVIQSKFEAATAPRQKHPPATPGAPQSVPISTRQKLDNKAESHSTRAPVIAIFDAGLQCLPWESVPCLFGQRLYRIPCLPCAAASHTNQGSEDDGNASIDPHSTYFVLNPSGDLVSTQETFETWFSNIRGWEGKSGAPPETGSLLSALMNKSLFVYCGHGGGEQYLPLPRLRALSRCAAALLMGCSSGRLHGGPGDGNRAWHFYEPNGAVLAYILAGCPAAVANLWDVTDRDIDRFAQAVLTEWLSSGSNEPGNDLHDVAISVTRARSACKLPYLIGAAPVCYGIPTTINKI